MRPGDGLRPGGDRESRLLKEFAAAVDQRAAVAVGRCLPYGEGITYWPLIEIVNSLTGNAGSAGLIGLLADDPQRQVVASRLAAVVGGRSGAATEQDVQWGITRLFDALARRGPLVIMFDDIHWAEQAMLDLVEHVSEHSSAPVLIVCSAREELFERRPQWARAGGRASVIRLEPLSDREAAQLLRRLAVRRGASVRRGEAIEAAGGNPLFMEQIVAMRADDPAIRVPPTVQALLAARIDALPADERRVIEAAAVEGRGFHRGAVATLVGGATAVDTALASLVGRQLIRRDTSEFADEIGYRFAHILVRDAAYDLLSKRKRADLHVAYAEWLLARVDRGNAADEIVGHHLERAYRYRVELGRADDARHGALAASAAAHLADAGRQALGVGDRGGAANLLERAVSLRSVDDPQRVDLLIDLGGVLREEGRFKQADATLLEASRLASRSGDGPLEVRAQVERLLAQLQVHPDSVAVRMRRHGAKMEAALEAAGDHAGLARLGNSRVAGVDQSEFGRGRAGMETGGGRGEGGRRRTHAVGRGRLGSRIDGDRADFGGCRDRSLYRDSRDSARQPMGPGAGDSATCQPSCHARRVRRGAPAACISQNDARRFLYDGGCGGVAPRDVCRRLDG